MKLLLPCALLLVLLNYGSVIGAEAKVGYPNRSINLDARPGFVSPPAGYGEVPFYWWYNDSLTKEQLGAKLDMLAGMKISSLQVNYCHTDTGGGSYGLTAKSKPALFTDEWWEIFGWFMGEAKKRGMTVSLSDYTLGIGQGFVFDEILKTNPEITGYELQFLQKEFSGEISWKLPMSEKPLSLVAYKLDSRGKIIQGSEVDLSKTDKDNTVQWSAPAGKWLATCVYDKKKSPSYDPMHPLAGKRYVQEFFQKFEDKFPEESKGGLNFFFSDELGFQLKGFIWNKTFKDEFIKRKKYDLTPYLAGLFTDIGDITPKIRLDYNDVMTSLSEENFFKPVYDWHGERGLIYGCDHGGRGRNVVEFGDYFRTQSWNQGPGSDQPRLGKNITKAKVAASIANMYQRPRVWLEGFYGSGWGTNTADLTDAIFANYAMGYNLLSLHGLYYNTMGGWWEWAPPCNHFHMPYWSQMGDLLTCTERLSYLLSQGHHVSDVAILYPVEPAVAGYGDVAAKTAFALGDTLYNAGVDFNFMDYQSLHNAVIKNGTLNISDLSFKVLIFPSMKAIKHESLIKALEFKRSGGVVICLGDLPESSDRTGANDPEVKKLVKEIFGVQSGTQTGTQTDVIFRDETAILKYIQRAFTNDFRIVSAPEKSVTPKIMHRKIGSRDLYAIYDVPKGSECFFRCTGAVELWNPWTGETSPISATKVTPEGTYVSMPLNSKEMQLIVFDPDKTVAVAAAETVTKIASIPLSTQWGFELKPVLDNQWGDFHYPATKELIGAEIRQLKYAQNGEKLQSQSLAYGPKFMILEALENPLDEKALLSDITNYDWMPYEFSWRWGVENDPGHQGYHGLKATMYDDFIRLGALGTAKHSKIRIKDKRGDNYYLYTYLHAEQDGEYEVNIGKVAPSSAYLNGEKLSSLDASQKVKLHKGANLLLLYYKGACTTYFVVQNSAQKGNIVKETLAERPLSMKWNGDRSVIAMSINKSAKSGHYSFESAPALKTLSFQAYGDNVEVLSNGIACELTKETTRADGLTSYRAVIKNPTPVSSKIDISIGVQKVGFEGGGAIPYPIKQQCGKGSISIGDWSKTDGLYSYSGGAEYTQSININPEWMKNRIVLNLGEVISTAELWINNKKIGLRLTPAWEFDITDFVVPGQNEVKIIIYNTASNHYTSIPTTYRGDLKSGIIGPVQLEILKTK